MVNAHSPTADFNTVQVRYKYVGWDASVIGGSVTFTPRASRAVDSAVKTIIIGRSITGTIASDGTGSVLLPATDDPDINVSFTYRVTENFVGGDTYDIQVPTSAEAAGLDLATLARTVAVDSPSGVFLATQSEVDALDARVDALEAGGGGTGGGGGATLADLRTTDANAFYVSGAYPTRASVTTDALRRVRWIGPVAPTISSTYATNGFDVWEQK